MADKALFVSTRTMDSSARAVGGYARAASNNIKGKHMYSMFDLKRCQIIFISIHIRCVV